MSLVVPLALLQNGILLAVVIVAGMILSEKTGLQMPLIRAWATGGQPPNLKDIVLPGMFIGATTGAVLVATEALFLLNSIAGRARAGPEWSGWNCFRLSLIGGTDSRRRCWGT